MRLTFVLLLFMFLHILGAYSLMLSPSDQCGVFTTLDGTWSMLPAPELTVSYNEEGLTIQGIFRKPRGEQFILKGKKDDDFAIFSGDVFEVQVNPPNKENNYYHLALGASGYIYTAKKRDIAWNPSRVVRQNKVSGNEWQFTLFISYSDLETSAPKLHDQWRMNLCRSNIDAKGMLECSSCSGAKDFHDVLQYTPVFFEKPGANKAPLLRQVVSDGAQVTFTFDRVSSTETLMAECTTGEISVTRALTAAPQGYSVTVPFGSYIPAKGYRLVSIALKNKLTGNRVFSQTASLAQKADLLLPDRFYYVAGEGEIVVQQRMGKNVVLNLKTATACLANIKDARSVEKIPLKGVAPGRYVLEAVQGKYRTTRVLFVLPGKPQLRPIPPNTSLKIGNGNYLELAGVPTYLWGVSASSHYFFQFVPATNLLCVPNGGQENGVINRECPFNARLHRVPATSYEFPDMETSVAFLKQFIAGLPSGTPALPRIRYEAAIPRLIIQPDGSYALEDTQARFARMYSEAKKANPNLLYTIHVDDVHRVKDYVSSCDVFEYASFASSYAKNMMCRLPEDIAQLKQHVSGKPTIFWLGGTVPDPQSRSAEELRCAVYCCILHGIAGNIVHLGHGMLPEERTRIWSLISGILAEVQTFYADFVTGTDMTAALRHEGAREILCKAVRTKKGEVMLLVINTSPVEVNFRGELGGKEYTKCLTPFEPYLFK